MEDQSTFRIKFAYFHSTWKRTIHSIPVLKSQGRRVLPSEFTLEMDQAIFCPECFTPLTRRPKHKDTTTNGRNASFAHLRSFRDVPCFLRSKPAEGKRYLNEEEAKKAISDDQLTIVKAFMTDRPEIKKSEIGIYDQNYLEDIDGGLSEVAIGRHTGESFSLPNVITTVAGFCRNFDNNYYKFFVLPGEKNAERLDRLLVDIKVIKDITDSPRLYFGKILSSWSKKPLDHSIRMTRLNWPRNDNYSDFYFKQENKDAQDKGIRTDSQGRYIIMYGIVEKSGTGLCLAGLGWGEFALLPEKYNYLLDDKLTKI
ncbi:hypothetical protein BZ17_683 [Yersinia pseudotuberculosis IP 32953]|uniref:Uncharacterized protein n=2 Tax=Yersinia pseudotuberculosis complex TaxID=1649845 RepID=Q66BH0_YERPS|nr:MULTISPECIES: hypothetical protein [Yersinia pseudotuberculosis complex]AHK20992.1 hypothetical protein BF17_18155 [Yersinia similis]AJJ55764.1 hypothetical protein BZ17_683 [Yersinia pseudotuberculosis IP 32953]KGA61427.1 hypothetical protein DJ55_287 [Yersinia pseudotuberculosis]PSH43229.1 hypothetical protein BA193_13050 [Yersinia pseudotuberculosis]PSH45769.1 hypothetical protein BA194_17835 [Yersinia pseudotuberculosis]